MAVANSGMTLYTSNDTQQSWAGTNGLDTEVSHDGGGSESWLVGKNSTETGTLSLTVALGTPKYFTFWMKSDWGAFYTQIDARLTDGTNLTSFIVATGGKHGTPNLTPEISGDFKPSILQIDQGSNASYVPNNHTQFSLVVNASSTGNVRAIVNHWVDGMWYGNGRTITGSTASDALFSESDALDTSSANYDGCSKIFDSGLAYYTDITANTTLGNSFGEVVTWYGKGTTDGIFKLSITGTASFQGTSIVGNACTIAIDSTTATSFGITGGSITNGGTMDFATGQTISGVVFTGCDRIDTNGATLTKCTINSTTATATGPVSGALHGNSISEIASATVLIFNEYTGKYAVYIPASVTGPITFDNWQFDGSGTDVYWAATTGTLVINKSAGSNPTTFASAGTGTSGNGDVIFTATFTLTLSNITEGTQVTIVNSTTRSELQNSSAPANGIITYSHSGGETVDILLMSLDIDPNLSDIFDLTLPNSDSAIKFQMIDDPNFNNPA